MNTDTTHESQDQQQNIGFNINIQPSENRTKTTAPNAEERAKEVFGIGDKTNVKRQREEYAIQLRK